MVVHGECGYLSEIGDVEDMSKNCLRLLKDRKLYDRFSKKARQCAVENYEVEKISRRYEDFYRKVLGC